MAIQISFIIIGIAILFLVWLIYRDSCKEEHFENPTSTGSVTFCPKGTTSYFDKSGDTLCCQGSVQANSCIGKPVCAMTSSHSTLPTCAAFMKTYLDEQAKTKCPSSMKNYFENPEKQMSGCTDSQLNDTMTGPRIPSASTCFIYEDDAMNMKSKDSCRNQKRLADAECFGTDCQKSLTFQSASNSNLVSIEFTGLDGHRHTCFTKDSYLDYLTQSQPNWQSKGTFDPEKNLAICDVAKKVYVDRTMDVKDAQV